VNLPPEVTPFTDNEEEVSIEDTLDLFAEILEKKAIEIQFYPQFLRDISSEIRELRAALEYADALLAAERTKRPSRRKTGTPR